MKSASKIPENHPLRRLFRTLTERGLAQSSVRDSDLLLYIADLLVEFLWMENLYSMRDAEGNRIETLVDMLAQAGDASTPEKTDYYKHLGDHSLFMLGMFPEYITRSRRAFSPSWYKDTGRIGYHIAGELDKNLWRVQVYRKLSDRFELCVTALNWVREYSTDPFYQWMFREFGIS